MGIPLVATTIQQPANPLDQAAKALSIKSMLQGQQIQGQEIQKNQMALDDATGMKKALIDANGDFSKFRANVKDAKYGVSVQGQLDVDNKIMAHQKSAYELDDASITNGQKKTSALAGMLQPLSTDWETVQSELPRVLNDAQVKGLITPQQRTEFEGVKNLDDFKQHVSGLQIVGDQLKQVNENRKLGQESWKPDGNGNMVNVDKTDPAFGKVMPISNPLPVPPDLAKTLGVPEMANKPVTAKQLKEMKDAADAGNKYENYGGNLNLVDSQGNKIKTMGASPAVAAINVGANMLKGDALDQSADRYLQTGQLPAGMRSPGMAAAIINRAAERGAGQSIAANTAGYKANEDSYKNVTKTLDTLSGFESAAVKNIDMFKGLVSKLPDTGVPWINQPLRTLDEKLVGAEWMPAINAAREIANREVARVTNDPKLSGVLSDSARSEVSSLNPKDATLAQIMHVTDLMKQDMANVHSSLSMQKADIGKRLGIQSNESNSPQNASKTLTLTQIQQAAKDHNVSVEEATRQAKAAGYTVQ